MGGKKETVAIEDLVPPFSNGDWISYRSDIGKELAPAGQLVWQAVGSPEFTAYPACDSGWHYLGVSSNHFRRATMHDIKSAMRAIEKRMKRIISRKAALAEALNSMRLHQYR